MTSGAHLDWSRSNISTEGYGESQNNGCPADTLWMKKAERPFFSTPSIREGYHEVIEALWQWDMGSRKDFFPWLQREWNKLYSKNKKAREQKIPYIFLFGLGGWVRGNVNTVWIFKMIGKCRRPLTTKDTPS